ncbi:hypothetical protein EB232_19240 [Mesorhizobium sp. NZP2077]|nr:hypothetical protein EB232_19240 [Mesorhizobium sp. NZP2077]
MTKLGNDYPTHQCKNDLPPGGKIHLVCGGLGFGFVFNEATLRFQQFYGFGFIDGDSAETPAITIGKCSSIPKRGDYVGKSCGTQPQVGKNIA